MTKKIICVWVGTCPSENDLYDNYLSFNYHNNIDEPESPFCKDTGLEYYDEDSMESWWFEEMSITHLLTYKDNLFDSTYFFDELIIELKKYDLTHRNFISFLFGEEGSHSLNENLFEYNGMKSKNKPIEFVFKKEYNVE